MKKSDNYAILRLIWSARGYVAKEVSSQLKRQWPKREGLAVASVQRKAQYGAKAPADIARFIKDPANFPIKSGYEEGAEVVRVGLAALEAGNVADPEALAASIAAKVPALDPEAIARAITSKRLRVPVVRLARKVAHALRAQFDVLAAKLDKVDAKLDTAEAKRDADTQAILRAVRTTGGLNGMLVLFAFVLLAGAFSDHGRDSFRAPEASNAPEPSPRVIIVTNVAQGGAPLAFDLQSFLAAIETGELGKKEPEEFLLPAGPLPGQKLPPCEARLREEAINGGCWTEIAGHPPCGLLFRGGDKCYRPIAADPTKPIGLPKQLFGQASH